MNKNCSKLLSCVSWFCTPIGNFLKCIFKPCTDYFCPTEVAIITPPVIIITPPPTARAASVYNPPPAPSLSPQTPHRNICVEPLSLDSPGELRKSEEISDLATNLHLGSNLEAIASFYNVGALTTRSAPATFRSTNESKVSSQGSDRSYSSGRRDRIYYISSEAQHGNLTSPQETPELNSEFTDNTQPRDSYYIQFSLPPLPPAPPRVKESESRDIQSFGV